MNAGWLRSQTAGLAGAALLVAAAMAAHDPEFLSAANLEVLAMNFVLEAFMALGMTLVIISGGIDLSVGAVLPFSAILTALLLRDGTAAPMAVSIALAASACVGAINGALSLALAAHPFVITLATMLSLRALNLVLTSAGPLSGLPPEFGWIGQEDVLGIPAALLLFVVLALAVGTGLSRHRLGQQTYLLGGNARAARASGVPTGPLLVSVYAISGLLAGVAGVVAASQYGSASAGFGQNSELRVITAVVIGGGSLSGGRGTLTGTIVGILFLAVVYSAFATTGVSTYWQDVVTGALVLAAVILNSLSWSRRTAPGSRASTAGA
jgi:ribose/xylose/arabinose/galactoside ABC-type transport system permease subunit